MNVISQIKYWKENIEGENYVPHLGAHGIGKELDIRAEHDELLSLAVHHVWLQVEGLTPVPSALLEDSRGAGYLDHARSPFFSVIRLKIIETRRTVHREETKENV